MTLAWEGAGSGSGVGTVTAVTANDCAATCASTSTLALDSQASAATRLSLVAAPDGDALLSWTSYAPSGGALATVVGDAYDPGPALTRRADPSQGHRRDAVELRGPEQR